MIAAIQEYCSADQEIVNIGAGGAIKDVLTREGVRFKEIDIDEKRRPDIVCSVEDMAVFKTSSVDVFFCMEVLEHVQNPFSAVTEITRVLKPGGVMIGSTPFMFPIHDEPYDFYRYTKYGIQHLFRDFDTVKLVERNSYIESIYVVLLRLLNVGSIRQRLVGVLLFPLYIVLLPCVLLLSLFVTNKQSTTGYFFIFKKPV